MSKEEKQQECEQYKKKMVGKRYRHFKGGVYIVIDIAVHSETEELMAVYKTFDTPGFTWVRPLEMFLSRVDKNKYPDITQEFRFERLDGDEDE